MRSKAAKSVLHRPSGLLVCPDTGELWTACGHPVGRRGKDGYTRVIARRAGDSCTTWYAHRLVWEVALGPIPRRMEIDHVDGNPSNNRLSNLQLVTGAENRRLQRLRCMAKYGSPSPRCKLTVREVDAVLRTSGSVPAAVWARRYGVAPSTIRCIRRKKTWEHVAAACEA